MSLLTLHRLADEPSTYLVVTGPAEEIGAYVYGPHITEQIHEGVSVILCLEQVVTQVRDRLASGLHIAEPAATWGWAYELSLAMAIRNLERQGR